MTNYRVLRRAPDPGGEVFRVITDVDANGPVQAVKAVTNDMDLPEEDSTEEFIAVPVRNWSVVGKSVKRNEPVVTYAEIVATTSSTGTSEPEPLTLVEDEGEKKGEVA